MDVVTKFGNSISTYESNIVIVGLSKGVSHFTVFKP